MTASRELFERVARDAHALFAREPAALVPVIAESCRIKAAIVSSDERESGPRRILNFGHTAAHALETVTRYRRFRHGEAVAYGMLVAAQLAVARGALAEADRQGLSRTIIQLGPLPPIGDVSTRQMIDAMRHDKKRIEGKLHYVLATAIGAATIVDDVTEGELEKALRKVGFAK
jgi:3-dehydroquinate synthase